MGFLNNAFQKLQAEAEKALDINNNNGDTSRSNKNNNTDNSSSSSSLTMAGVMHYDSTATRWEKAVVATDSIVAQVTKFDPDGVDVVCVGGGLPDIIDEESSDNDNDNDNNNDNDNDNNNNESNGNGNGVEWYRNIHDTKTLEEKVTSKDPKGPCPLGQAMSEVLKVALQKDLSKTPCSVLVLTAGRPDDAELLEEALRSTAQHIADESNGGETSSLSSPKLSVTFIQIGNDDEASRYLKYLDKKMVGICDNDDDDDDDDDDDSTGNKNKIDIVDTMSYDEIKDTMDQMKEYTAQTTKEQQRSNNAGKHGAIFGAVAGAALGVGGMYLFEKGKANKRIKSGSWQGKWKCFYEDEEITTLSIKDDKQGNLHIDGFQDTLVGSYLHTTTTTTTTTDEEEEDFFIRFTDPTGDVVEGTFNEKLFILEWSDGTRWEALNKTNWAGYVGAASAGAAAVGATGYMVDKKFFHKMNNKDDNCDYIIVMDRSANMASQ